jgi:hypothetical protein
MKPFTVLALILLSSSAFADTHECDLRGLSQGQQIRKFELKAPNQVRVLTTLPGDTYRVVVWIYEGSIGVQVENLLSNSIELSTQMTSDSTHGDFDLTVKAADFRLACSVD